jgi:D-amino-acid dehydrogenase
VSYCPIDESGDCEKFTRELATVCAAEGVEFIYNTSVDDFVVQNGRISAVIAGAQRYEADEFVIAAGVGSAALAKKLGEYLPVYPMKGYSITAPIKNNAPKISITDEARRIVYSTIGDRLRVAGIAEFSGFNMKIRRPIMDKLIQDASSSMPDAADFTQVEEWTGLRPMTPSTVPIIGRSKRVSNLAYNVGQGMLGWTLACGSAKRLAKVF